DLLDGDVVDPPLGGEVERSVGQRPPGLELLALPAPHVGRVNHRRHGLQCTQSRTLCKIAGPAGFWSYPSNGPLPIWSRAVTTGGGVRKRRSQLAPSTTRVWPAMKRA